MVTSTIQTAVVHVRRSLLPQCPGTGARMFLDGLEWFVEALGEQNTTDVTWKLSLKRTITKAASRKQAKSTSIPTWRSSELCPMR